MEGYVDYSYDRGNVNNPDRVFPAEHAFAGKQKYLSKDIEEAFPAKAFIVRCDDKSLCVFVKNEHELTDTEKLILDKVILDHKNNY